MSQRIEKKSWRLGEILVQNGWVTWDNLQKALDMQSDMNRSMGQVLADCGIMTKKQGSGLQLGEILVKNGWLDWKNLGTALEIQRETGRIIGEILVERKFITEKNLYRALAIQAGVPFVDFKNITVSQDALSLLPKHVAYDHRIMPLVKKESIFLVATSNARNFHFETEIKNHVRGFDIRIAVASPIDIETALHDYYGPEMGISTAKK